MNEKNISPLYSDYIIDGIPQELTPAQMLSECMDRKPSSKGRYDDFAPILDESVDPPLKDSQFDSWRIQDYLEMTASSDSPRFPVQFPAQHTRLRIAQALLEALCRDGHFRLGDISVEAEWHWNADQLGNMAAFYSSAQAASEYIDSLGIRLGSYTMCEPDDMYLDVKTRLLKVSEDDEDLLSEMPDHSFCPTMSRKRRHGAGIVDDPRSWLVYIPFDTCDYRLGGSLLSGLTGVAREVAAQIDDPDYFIDCFEVVRELIEDDIVIACNPVGEGGLITSLKAMADASRGAKTGAKININEIMKSSKEPDPIRILFSEVPGMVIQIRDEDFDYIDAELTLQDVAFFPLGHPTPGLQGIKVDTSDKGGIQTILESLIRSQSSEGED